MKRWIWPSLLLAAHVGFWAGTIAPHEQGSLALLWLLFPVYPIMRWPDQAERASS